MRNRVVLISGIVIATILLGLAALPFAIDVNSFRPALQAKASAALGRQVRLGNLKLSILSGKVVADDIEIADDPAFSQSNFITAKSLEISVELLPLIVSRQLNVTGIILDDPQITLIRADNGSWNFSSLSGPLRSNQDASKTALPTVEVKRFRINSGRLVVQKGSDAGETRTYDNFSAEVTDFSTASQFPFKLATQLPGGGDASLSGQVGPINTSDAARTPFEASLKVIDMDIATYRFVAPASGIAGMANMDETVHSDGTTATFVGTFSGSRLKLSPAGSPARRTISIRHNVEIDFVKESAIITQADISVGSAQLHATGTIKTAGAVRIADIHLTGPNMPIDELQAVAPALDVKQPFGSYMKGGTVSIDMHIKGPSGAWVISGPVSVENTTQVGFNLGAQLGSVSGFAGKAISSPDTSIRSLSLDLVLTQKGVVASNIKMDIPSVSQATGAGTISPAGELNFAMLSIPSSGVVGGLTKMASVGGGQGRVPMTIRGTAEKPIITADVKGAAKSIAGETAKGVASKIGGLFSKKKKQE